MPFLFFFFFLIGDSIQGRSHSHKEEKDTVSVQTSRLEEFSLSYEAGPAVRNIPEDDKTIAVLESINFYENIGCNKCSKTF